MAKAAKTFGWALAAIVTPLFATSGVRAGELEVAPTTIQLSPRTHASVVTLTNRGSAPVTVQVEAYDWRQTNAGDVLAPSETLIASPPMASLAPGQHQLVRLLDTAGAPVGDERAFRLLVSELPGPTEATPGQAVRVLLQFSLPAFEAPAAQATRQLTWDAKLEDGHVVLTAQNQGNRHVRLSGADVAANGQTLREGPAALTYLLAGSERRWRLAAPGAAEGARLTVRRRESDDGPIVETAMDVHR